MATERVRERAMSPDDLPRLWRESANEGDIDGILALYESGAVTTFGSGAPQIGHAEIRAALEKVLANRKPGGSVTSGLRPTLIAGDLALDFANTTDGPDKDHLRSYADLVTWARRAGVLPATVRPSVVCSAR